MVILTHGRAPREGRKEAEVTSTVLPLSEMRRPTPSRLHPTPPSLLGPHQGVSLRHPGNPRRPALTSGSGSEANTAGGKRPQLQGASSWCVRERNRITGKPRSAAHTSPGCGEKTTFRAEGPLGSVSRPSHCQPAVCLLINKTAPMITHLRVPALRKQQTWFYSHPVRSHPGLSAPRRAGARVAGLHPVQSSLPGPACPSLPGPAPWAPEAPRTSWKQCLLTPFLTQAQRTRAQTIVRSRRHLTCCLEGMHEKQVTSAGTCVLRDLP